MEILFLGHSLVEYYDWQARFPRHAVHNLGVAGETAGGLLARLDTVAAAHPAADLILVMTGTNDVLMGDQSFPDVFRLLSKRIAETWPRTRTVIFGVLPAHPEWMDPATVRGINGELEKIAEEAGFGFCDLTGRFTDRAGGVRTELLLGDGVHLGEEGYRLWSGAVEELLEEAARQA